MAVRVGASERKFKSLFGIIIDEQENNIKRATKETESDRINVAEDGEHRLTLINIVINFMVP